jgi:cytochrome c5
MARRKTDLSEGATLAIILSGLVGIVGIMLVLIAIVTALVNSGKTDSVEAGASAASSRPVLSREAAAIATINAVSRTSSPTGNASAIAQADATSPINEGERLFQMTCISCHGQDARGIVGLGKDLVDSEFVNTTDDSALMMFLKTGRPIWDPANTTGVEMPARGGNPALTDDQLLAIVGYMRSLN